MTTDRAEDRALRRAQLALQIGGSVLLAAVGLALGALHGAYLDELAAHGEPRETPLGIALVWVFYFLLLLTFYAIAFGRTSDLPASSSFDVAAADEDSPSPYSPNGSHLGPAERGRPARPAPHRVEA